MDIAGVDVEIDVIRELPELEDLEVNASTEDQSFNSSKYGFKNVIIKGIKGDKLELNPSLEQQNVKGVFTEVNINPIQTKKLNATPTTQEQVISGLFDEVTVNAIEGQELNLNPSEEQQNYEGVFLGVNINPIQVEEITTDLDFSSSNAIELTAQEGVYIKKATINKDVNLTPENIKSGVSILGVSGDVADTSDADATSNDIIAGKTAYVANEKIAGTYIPLDTSDATATAEDIVKDKTAYVNGEKIIGTREVNLTGIYKFLDYIESDGNQYINTGYNPTTNSQFELEFSEFNGVGCLFGAYHADWDKGIGLLTDTTGDFTFWFHHYGNYNSNIPCSKSGTVLIDKNVLNINSKTFTAPSKSSSYGYPIFLFGANWNGTYQSGVPMRLHKFIVKENNIVLHHFVPVINMSRNEVGMYDVVERKFFANGGTGSFIAGPEV